MEKNPSPLTNSRKMLRETGEGDGENRITKPNAPSHKTV